MNKQVKILMVVLFSILLITANYSLFSEETDCVKCDGCGHKMEKGKDMTVAHQGKTLHACSEKCKDALKNKAAACTSKTTYKCPMKACNFTSDKDGKCEKCGMALVKVESKPVYKCTTEGCNFTSDKEGKCPHCKTDLKKAECKPVYKCTTEGCKFTSDKEGKCPHCKTDLKKAECCAHKSKTKMHKMHTMKEGETK